MKSIYTFGVNELFRKTKISGNIARFLGITTRGPLGVTVELDTSLPKEDYEIMVIPSNPYNVVKDWTWIGTTHCASGYVHVLYRKAVKAEPIPEKKEIKLEDIKAKAEQLKEDLKEIKEKDEEDHTEPEHIMTQDEKDAYHTLLNMVSTWLLN